MNAEQILSLADAADKQQEERMFRALLAWSIGAAVLAPVVSVLLPLITGL